MGEGLEEAGSVTHERFATQFGNRVRAPTWLGNFTARSAPLGSRRIGADISSMGQAAAGLPLNAIGY